MSSFGSIIAWYTTLSKLHKPFKGQLLRDLQLHSIFFTIIIIIIIIIIYSVIKFINYLIIMTIYYLRNISSVRITNFQSFSIKCFM